MIGQTKNTNSDLIGALSLVLVIAAKLRVFCITTGGIRNNGGNRTARKRGAVGSGPEGYGWCCQYALLRCGASPSSACSKKWIKWIRHAPPLNTMAAEMEQTTRAMETGLSNPSDKEGERASIGLGSMGEEFSGIRRSLHHRPYPDEATAITRKKTSPLMDALQKNAAELARVSRLRAEASQQPHSRRSSTTHGC